MIVVFVLKQKIIMRKSIRQMGKIVNKMLANKPEKNLYTFKRNNNRKKYRKEKEAGSHIKRNLN